MTLYNLTARSICILLLSAVGCGRHSTPTPTAKTLHQAVIFYPDQIPTLIANGAEIDELDSYGNSALWVAARHSKTESVRWLLAGGADPNIRGQRGWTPLHCTIFCWSASADSEIAQLLIKAGADVNSVEPEYGETPFHYAVRVAESPELVRLLLDGGAEIDAQSYPGKDTALQFAVARRKHTITELLLKADTSPTIENKVGFVPQQQSPEDDKIATLFKTYAGR